MRFLFNPITSQFNSAPPREIIYSETAPAFPVEGTRWVNTLEIREYVFTFDANGAGYWVEVGIGSTGPQGEVGDIGPVGPVGPQGIQGVQGPAATVAVGTVSTGEPGTSVSVSNAGTSGAAVLDFTIPRGAVGQTGAVGPQGPQGIQGLKGDTGNAGPQGIQGLTGPAGPVGAVGPAGTAASVSVGTTTTGAAGTNASVTNSGTSSAAVLNFTIPRGETGVAGPTGPQGPAGTSVVLKGSVANLPLPTTGNTVGDLYVVTATGDGYVWGGSSWSNVGPIRGPVGPAGSTGAVGPAGTAASVSVGTTTTGAAGTNASVTNSGTTSAAVLNFTVPRGATGANGVTGATGAVGPQGPQGIQGVKGDTGAQGPAGPAPAGTGAVVVSSGTLGTPVGYGTSNTANTLVQRDAGGNFSAGTITANVTGNVTGSVTGGVSGNAGTATKLATPRTINVSGDVTGTAQSFDGSADISIPTAITAGSIVDADINTAANISDTKLATISTANKVSNSATTATSANTANAIVARDTNGNFSANQITANLTGTVTGNATNVSGTVAILNGGTGASTAAGALVNLGAAASSHAHGNITNAGAIGTTASLPIITGASGVLQAGAFGTAAGSFCQGNDTRLSDPRTPSSHTHGNITDAGAIGTTATLPIITGVNGVLQAGAFGTAAGSFCQGNDARLSDARTPSSHPHGNITNAGAIGTTASLPIITGASGVLQAGAFGTTAGSFCQGDDARFQSIPSAWTSRTSAYTAVAGDRISADTRVAAFTLTLPASPAAFTEIVFADHYNQWATRNLTIARNGQNIEGLAEDLVCNVAGLQITMRYEGTTWRVYL